ncbi:MAG: EI24 domain-containing protein [Vicingaceae bacterium]
MGFLKDLQIGITSYGKAVDFIFRHKLAWFFLIPIGLNIILFLIGYNFVSELTEQAITLFQLAWEPDSWEFRGADFLAGTVNFFIWLVLRLFFFLIFAFIGGYIILILMSPILAYLSEKTEKIILGTDVPFSWIQLIKDMWRGILLAIRNFLIEVGAMILLFFLSFVPLIGLISTPLLFLISSYFYGFSFLDYTCERRRLKVKDSIHFVRKNRGLAIANGALFAFALLIPIIGVSLSGFLAIISTVAATLAVLRKEELLSIKN